MWRPSGNVVTAGRARFTMLHAGGYDDVRFAIRSLLKSPGFTIVAIAMLALGIGVNATVFTVTNAVLFKGFPRVANNDRIAYISNGGCCISYADFEDFRAQSRSFEGLAITHGITSVLVDGKGFAERLSVTEVSADAFRLVGQHPIIGRDFAGPDEQPGAPAVAMLTYDFWQSRYAKDPKIVGRTVRINGAPSTIVGVMPEGFSFPQKQDIWVPLVKTAAVENRANHDTWMAFGPLKPGVALENARAEIQTIAKRLAVAYPATSQDDRVTVQNFHQFMIGDNASLLYGSMWGAVGFVLLIACANLANLLLARAIGRSREISVRIALGAGRWRIIRQLLVESVLLSSIGGICGWWLATWGVRAYALAMAHKSSWLIVDYAMDNRVIAYLIGVSIGTGLLFGLLPAMRLSKLDVNVTLKDGGRGATGRTGARRLSALLVAGEMGLAIVLLAGAGVMIRSFLKVHDASMGIDAARLYAGEIALPAVRYKDADVRISFFEHLKQRLANSPGIESAAIAAVLPPFNAAHLPYEIAGNSDDPRHREKLSLIAISPGYFRTMGARVLAGRDFTEHDRGTAPLVVIVNEKLAQNAWAGENPLGKQIRFFDGKDRGPWLTVVGVASNIVQNDLTRQRFDPIVYAPYMQGTGATTWVLARSSSPGTVAIALRRAAQMQDPDLPVYGPVPVAARFVSDNAFYGTLLLIFAVIALLLACAGLYAVIAHSVNQRTQEIGVRMAMGATAADIRKIVLWQGMVPVMGGLAAGVVASLAANRLLASELVAISPSDPTTLAASSALLIVAGLLGCLIPVRRAMRVDPVVALRHE